MKFRTIEINGTKEMNTSLTTSDPRNIFIKSGAVGQNDPRFANNDGSQKLIIRLNTAEKVKIRVLSESGMTDAKVAQETGRSIGTVQRYKRGEKKSAAREDKRPGRRSIGKHEIKGMIHMRYVLHRPVSEIAEAFDRSISAVYNYTNPVSRIVIESGVLTR